MTAVRAARIHRATAADAPTAAALLRSLPGVGQVVVSPGPLDHEQWSLYDDDVSVVRIESRGTRVRVALDGSPDVLCVLVSAGRVQVARDHRRAELARDDCGLVTAGDRAALEWEDASFQLVALPPATMRRTVSRDDTARRLIASRLTPASQPLGTLWARLGRLTVHHLVAGGDLLDHRMLRTTLLDALVATTVEAFDIAEVIPPGSDSDDRVVERAERFMSAHLAEAIRLTDIARSVGVSTRSLQLAYQRRGVESPTGHLRRLRMEAAARALGGGVPGTPIAGIARRVGYTNVGRFGAHFRASYGESPSARLRRAADPASRTAGASEDREVALP